MACGIIGLGLFLANRERKDGEALLASAGFVKSRDTDVGNTEFGGYLLSRKSYTNQEVRDMYSRLQPGCVWVSTVPSGNQTMWVRGGQETVRCGKYLITGDPETVEEIARIIE